MQKQTLLVIDDQKDFAELVRRSLEAANFEVIVASNGATGLAIAQQHRPDLVVLDLTMPDLDGLVICQRLRSDPRLRALPILVLSARASAADRVLGLQSGADDYLVKPFVPQELVARVNAILRRCSLPPPHSSLLRHGELQIDLNGRCATHNQQPIQLTAAQFRILELLALQPGRVFSRDEIIESALRHDVGVTERTVDAHIVGIRRALGSLAHYIETVRGFGYKLQPPAASADERGIVNRS